MGGARNGSALWFLYPTAAPIFYSYYLSSAEISTTPIDRKQNGIVSYYPNLKSNIPIVEAILWLIYR